MKKIVPLINLNQVDNYISNGVDAVVMGTYFGATRIPEVYDLEEMMEVNEKIPVVASYNRFYFEHELEQLKHELKALHEGGVDRVLCGDFGVLQTIYELDLDFYVIFSTDTTMTNVEEISILLENGASEVMVGRELTLDKQIHIAKSIKKPIATNFFGHQLMSFSRRKHLSQYKDLRNINMDPKAIHYLKESNREDMYMVFEDTYGTHTFAPGIFSAVHVYPQLKESGFKTIFFDVFGLDIEDVLFVVRTLDLIEDYDEFETIISETMGKPLNHGLLYEETEKHKEVVKKEVS